MIDFEALHDAFGLLFGSSLTPLLVMIPGLIIGTVFGAVPGMTTSLAMAIFLPLTLHMDFLSSLLFLTAIFTGGGFGCAIPAVLIKVPGMPSAVATTFDGFSMVQRLGPGIPLGVALGASCAAAALGYAILLPIIEPLASFVLLMGPAELLLVALWGVTLIATLSGKSLTRGLLSGIVGLLIGTIGLSDRGIVRGTLGIDTLYNGVPYITALMGLFISAELFNMIGRRRISESEVAQVRVRHVVQGLSQTFRFPGPLLRGGVIGAIVGAVPGVGSSISNLVSYNYEQRKGPRGDEPAFGKGNPRGVVAAEAANNSSEGGSMATLLALGIPGGGGTAVLLGAMAMHGVAGGPQFISTEMDLVYGIILGNLLQALLLIPLGVMLCFVAAQIVAVPVNYLIPSVLGVSVLGSFAIASGPVGPVTFAVFAMVGWFMKRAGFSVVPMVVGLVLGDLLEGQILRTYQVSGATLEYFTHRPITLTVAGLLVMTLLWPAIRKIGKRWHKGPQHREPAEPS